MADVLSTAMPSDAPRPTRIINPRNPTTTPRNTIGRARTPWSSPINEDDPQRNDRDEQRRQARRHMLFGPADRAVAKA